MNGKQNMVAVLGLGLIAAHYWFSSQRQTGRALLFGDTASTPGHAGTTDSVTGPFTTPNDRATASPAPPPLTPQEKAKAILDNLTRGNR